jgi:tetratricopeptide (TPR) repeat protein
MDYNDKESPYRIHTLLHDYAKSLLKEKEASEARQGHFACFQNFAQSYADVDLIDRNDKVQAFETFYPQMMQALANFEQEYNVKNSNLKSKQLQSAIELIDILDKRWALHDSFDAQVKWLAIGYDVARKIKKPLKQAGFARRVGRVNGWLGELDDGLKWMKKCATALGSSKSREANTIRAHMYIHRASLKYQKNSLKEAGKDCADGVKMVTQKSQPGIYAEGYNLLGVIKIRTNQLSSASELLEKSLSAWKQVGDQYQISRVEENIRSALYYLGDIASLRSAEEAGLKYWEQFPERIQYATALTNRGLVHYIDEEYETAVELHKRAMQISDSHGHSRLSALTRVNLAYPYISLGKYDEAETLLNESMAVQEEHDIMEYWINAKCCQAELEIGRGHYAEAIKFAEVAVKLAEEDDDPLEKGTALRALGQACYLNGDLKQAKEHLENSLTLLREDEYKYEVYLTLRALGKMDNSYDGEAQSLAKEIGLR